MPHSNARVYWNLQKAITTMRGACDEATLAIEREDDHDAARRVLHAFTWGLANASNNIECAMSALEDAQTAHEA